MGFGFDIFRRLDDGSPLWVAQAHTVDDAHRQVVRKMSPGEYFVRDAATGGTGWGPTSTISRGENRARRASRAGQPGNYAEKTANFTAIIACARRFEIP